ncbi:MAG: bifunctional (p)ppGpp synthetase/guanosine-3',5'-bis(diphosphate) 3'-pyrophosphohydrolase [Anaerolineae bacterium]|nr:bifunctional (p)ppGpp synthetase/guanosine-3',5'-bis(diphosphate) 3'-pyrophosphohydrolase [Anaerolineae bacterium]
MDIIERAIEFATRAHAGQMRKGTDISYITHPYAVGMILAQAGCEPEVIAAGLLHDTIEDTGTALDEIRQVFGARIGEIVAGCTEPDKSLPWETRKQHTIESLRHASPDIRLVHLADKLHNVHSMLRDDQRLGEALWARFKRGKVDQAWYYREMLESLRPSNQDGASQARLYRELEQGVAALFGTP